MDSISINVLNKGRRLADAGAVREVTKTRLFEVDGDTGTYLVTVEGIMPESCTCPSVRRCSHIHAVSLTIAREMIPDNVFEGLY